MGQRVNIQYSIDIDDLPSAVAALLQEAIGDLADVVGDAPMAFTKGTVMELSTLQKIQQIRTNLESIDHRLGDVSALVNSYISYHTNSPQTEEKEEAPTPEVVDTEQLFSPLQGQTTTNDLDNLQSQIERFREVIAAPPEDSNEATS
jgi:hypothetical protein